jgi:hypothetical protein
MLDRGCFQRSLVGADAQACPIPQPCRAYGLAIIAVVLIVTIVTGHLPRGASASHNETNDTMNVQELQTTGDAKALPRQEITDEVYR